MSSKKIEERQTEEEMCLARHRKERKDLQADIQKLKNNVGKGDKKKKKEIAAQIAILESQLDQRHDEELEMVKQEAGSKKIATTLEKLNINDELSGIDEPVDHQTELIPKTSKSQKRKARKAQKDAEANERIRQGEMESKLSDRRIEEEKFEKILTSRDLQICQIPSNGDCLYASFVHQLSQHKINATVASLRSQAGNYMRNHVDEFLPFFVKEGNVDLYTPEEYLEYCDRVEKTSEWGGQAELRALSDTLSARIEVVQVDIPSVFIGNHFKDNVNIVVTYHRHAYGLGEHYNSVEPQEKREDNKDDLER